MTTTRTPASGAADKVLAYLDDLSDDAAAHIFPSDLAKCMTSECVVEVVSVRAGNPNERTVPLFSREQVVAALASTPAQPVAEPAPSATAHVGDSLFESWFSEYNPAHRGTKQQMRDAYAAGMGDPKAQPSPTPQASHGQAPAGANENAELVTLIAECRDAFPIPAHGDPIENYWSAAIADPANVPAYLQEIAKRKQADSVQEDAARLDWLEQNLFHREMDEWDVKFGGRGDHNMWVLFAPKGVQGSARRIIDAAMSKGAPQ